MKNLAKKISTRPRLALTMGRSSLLLAVLVLTSACATPIGVTQVSTQSMYRSLTASVLSGDRPSEYSEQLLTRLGLEERFEQDPEVVLAALRGPGEGLSREYLFVLSELSFYHAVKSNKPEYFLASAVYAWAFVLGRTDEARVDPLDPRLRLATNLYNLGLAQGLEVGDEATVVLEPGSRPLPFGQIEISVDEKLLLWSGYRMTRFVSLGEFKVRGFLNRYRQAGIGAPLAAELTAVGTGPEAEEARKRIPPRLKVPVTAVLRIEDVSTGIATGNLRGRIEVYAADAATTVEAGGRNVPLELEPTAALAYQLEGAPVWDTELGAFLAAFKPPFPGGLLMMHPYRPGRVPVVLVHGTASSPARWADIINELQNDPKLRGRIQFWLFTYNTSNPVLLSASDLRQSLQRIRKEVDPDGRDPALDRLVVIGHSQGGLLTRLMVTDSGTRFWDSVTDTPFDKIDVSPETRALIQRSMFFEPLPYVKRVIFIATPHQGSFRVSSLVLSAVRKLVTLPLTLVTGIAELADKNKGLPKEAAPTAVDNMLPGNRFVRTLSASPIAPGVTAHSIIPVTEAGRPAGQNDGVVRYESAHLEGVASEKIVRSTHSTQSTPATILEIRRILYEHLGIACGLECEVPDRVDAAVESAPKPEPPVVRTDAVQGP
jgi:pimeloyl-ACP methyl ester carboxylesterase